MIFSGSEIKVVLYTKHLGDLIGTKVRHKMIEDIQNDFIILVNFIMSNFGNCNHDVKYKLMKSYCMALYGAVLWDATDPKVNAFCSSWRCFLKLILEDLNARSHSNLLYLVVENLNIEGQIYRRKVKFLNSILTSRNPILSKCGNLIKEGSRSSVSQSICSIL